MVAGRARRGALAVRVGGLAIRLGCAAGEYELCCRASDAAGNTQPTEPDWNVGGYCNNAVQRVRVTVS